MIYVIRADGTGYAKVGYVKTDVYGRMAELQIGCPYELVLVAYGEGDLALERTYHRKLKSCGLRVRGEWFLNNDEFKDIMRWLWTPNDRNTKALKNAPQVRANRRLARALQASPEQLTGSQGCEPTRDLAAVSL